MESLCTGTCRLGPTGSKRRLVLYSTGLVFRRPNYNNVRRCPFPVPRWITVIGIGIGIAIAIAIGN